MWTHGNNLGSHFFEHTITILYATLTQTEKETIPNNGEFANSKSIQLLFLYN